MRRKRTAQSGKRMDMRHFFFDKRLPIRYPFRFKFRKRSGKRNIRRVFRRAGREKRNFRIVVYGDGKGSAAAEQFRKVIADRYAYVAQAFYQSAERIRKTKVKRDYAQRERNRYVVPIIDLFDFL